MYIEDLPYEDDTGSFKKFFLKHLYIFAIKPEMFKLLNH